MLFDFDTLHGEGFYLKKEFTVDADPSRNWVPACHFSIRLPDGTAAGRCDLRVGRNENLYYGGNVGYTVDAPYRGQHLAGRAVLLLKTLARRLGMEEIVITCDPANAASRRTCEYAGGRLETIAPLPVDNDLYLRGMREVCIYRFTLAEEADACAR